MGTNQFFKISILGIILLFVNVFSIKAQESKPIKWYTFEEAIALNAKSPKLIFIDVYTEWCGWCKKMDASTFADPKVAEYMNKNFYCVKLDAEQSEPINFMGQTYINPKAGEKRSTHQIAAVLLQNKMSYPSYVFMNEQNKILTVVKGYMTVENFDPVIHWFAERAYLKVAFQEYSESFKAKSEPPQSPVVK